MSSIASLMTERRFWPLFWVQFSGAFNDNVLKQGLILMVTFSATLFGREITILGMDANLLNPLGGVLLMLPFLLFSASFGMIADKYSKSTLMRIIKLVEIGLMVVGGLAFATAAMGYPETSGVLLLLLVFLMGTQSAAFGPIKYSILPQLLPKPADLIAGNALVEMGTYFSVVFGIILATLLFEIPNYGLYILGASVVIIAILGWLAARAAPQLPAENPDLKVAKEPFTATWRAAKIVFSKKNLAMAVLANSWFWALGAGVLSMFPTFVRDSLGGGAAVQTLLTVMFSVGIALGSLACVRLSKGRIEMGLVFFGGIGISVFLADIWFGNMTAHADTEHLMGVVPFFQQWQAWRLTIDLLGVSASGGFFMVPLYTYLQHHGEVGDRGQLIGALNIINAALIVAGQIVIMGLIIAGLSEAFLFFVIAIANLLVAFAIYRWLPERPARLLLQWAVGAMYRHNVIDRHNVPSEGAALIICNHISYLDWAILMAGTQRKHRFVIDLEMSKIPLAGTLARHCEVIPTTSDTSKRQVIVRSFKQISAALRNGELVVVFPEGALPYEADLAPFMRGLQLILKRDPVPVVPMAINGMWGSMYSRNNGRAFRSWRPPFRKIWLTVGEPIDPEDVTLTDLEDAVRELWKRKPSDP